MWCPWRQNTVKQLRSSAGEDSWESLGQQRDQTRKSTLNIQWKDWCWRWSSNTLAIWYEELTYWKRPWCWERLRAEGEGGDRGWDSWMALLTQWTWVWVNSGRQWRIGVLQSMGSQRAGHNWATEQSSPPRSSECHQMQRTPAYTTAGMDPPTSSGLTKPRPPHLALCPGCPDRPVNRLRTIRGVNTPRKTSCCKLSYRSGIFSTVHFMECKPGGKKDLCISPSW